MYECFNSHNILKQYFVQFYCAVIEKYYWLLYIFPLRRCRRLKIQFHFRLKSLFLCIRRSFEGDRRGLNQSSLFSENACTRFIHFSLGKRNNIIELMALLIIKISFSTVLQRIQIIFQFDFSIRLSCEKLLKLIFNRPTNIKKRKTWKCF